MKKIVSIILLIAVGIGIGIVVPNFFTGEVEAANNTEIVGTWVLERMSNGTSYCRYYQFKDDGTGIYTEDAHLNPADNEYITFNYSYNGEELIIDGVKSNCSIVGNGMFLYSYISNGKVGIREKPNVYVRA